MTAKLECELARIKRELVEVRKENVKCLMIASDYQRQNELLRQEARINESGQRKTRRIFKR